MSKFVWLSKTCIAHFYKYLNAPSVLVSNNKFVR